MHKIKIKFILKPKSLERHVKILSDYIFHQKSLVNLMWILSCIYLDQELKINRTLSLREKCSYSEFFWSLFPRIRTEYGEIRSISLYSFECGKIRTLFNQCICLSQFWQILSKITVYVDFIFSKFAFLTSKFTKCKFLQIILKKFIKFWRTLFTQHCQQ